MFNDGIRTDVNEKEINKNIAAIFFRNEKAARLKHGLSTGAMAECLGCNQGSISHWETGRYVPKDLDSIIKKTAELFDLDPEVLMSEDFADRYNPDAYSEKPKDLTPIAEIDAAEAYPVPEPLSDKDITIRYLNAAMEEQRARCDRAWQIYKESYEAFENYKNTLIALGVDVENRTDG